VLAYLVVVGNSVDDWIEAEVVLRKSPRVAGSFFSTQSKSTVEIGARTQTSHLSVVEDVSMHLNWSF
jgi:hypothetical protein